MHGVHMSLESTVHSGCLKMNSTDDMSMQDPGLSTTLLPAEKRSLEVTWRNQGHAQAVHVTDMLVVITDKGRLCMAGHK